MFFSKIGVLWFTVLVLKCVYVCVDLPCLALHMPSWPPHLQASAFVAEGPKIILSKSRPTSQIKFKAQR